MILTGFVQNEPSMSGLLPGTIIIVLLLLFIVLILIFQVLPLLICYLIATYGAARFFLMSDHTKTINDELQTLHVRSQ